VFLDETGLSLVPSVARSWALKGRTPVLVHPQRSWSKLNQIAALSVSPARRRLGLYWRFERGKAASQEAIASFIAGLLRHLRGPVIVVLDNLPAHKGAAVRAVERRHRRLRLAYLPPYAPELNPCELLFAHQKRPLANHGLPDLDCLFDHADERLQRLHRRQDLLRSFIDGTPLKIRWPT
jgi:DDE superfamily endonuclease